MADDSSYYPDVIRWLLAHPEQHPDYLVEPRSRPPRRLPSSPKTSCDIAASKSAPHARRRRPPPHRRLLSRRPRHARVRLRHQLPLRPVLAVRPTTTRPSASTACSIRYEQRHGALRHLLGNREAAQWTRRAAARKAAIDKYSGIRSQGCSSTTTSSPHKRSTYSLHHHLLPALGRRSPRREQAAAVAVHLRLFERAGGLAIQRHRLRHAVGRALRLGAHQLARRLRAWRAMASTPTPPASRSKFTQPSSRTSRATAPSARSTTSSAAPPTCRSQPDTRATSSASAGPTAST